MLKRGSIPMVLIAMLTVVLMMTIAVTPGRPGAASQAAPTTAPRSEVPDDLARAVFAGGCFWCVEAVFEELEGVHEVVSGYAGGTKETANYQAVCSGRTRHAEVVEIRYDPETIDYETLLAVHFATHDPTTKNRQGADTGPQYRSAIFYADESEKRAAEAMIARLNDSDAFAKPIVTTLEPLETFYPAEAYHQDYVCTNPLNPYVQGVALPKVEKVRAKFKDRLKKTQPAADDAPTVSVHVFDEQGRLVGPVDRPKDLRSDAEWRRVLTPEQHRILRKAGTERAFCGTLLDNKTEGVYACAGCDLPLFGSDAKFVSGTGWPSFHSPIGDGRNVAEKVDRSHGMVRTEILCARCDGHLGHVFDDGPRPTGRRYCLNSESLRFVETARLGAELGERASDPG